MSELSTERRNLLGRAIMEARREAEAGAKKVLAALAVEGHEPHGSMSVDERALRNRLRARGRQLGDVRDKTRGTQAITHLAHEVAYEHWHRMLFARFLAENGLLIEPESGVAITMAECEELAGQLGEDPRTLAARFAQDSLPQIFRVGDPVLDVALPPETRQALDRLLDSLPAEVFTADDSLGWTYQYWQAEAKDAVNASGTKIGADELPAVTQLFTEHYMVLFLYHNTIGAWHAGKVLAANPRLAESAKSEEELRAAVSFETDAGRSGFGYLRFVREARDGDEDSHPTGPWRPAAGAFEGWPERAAELKVLDPCCGSGHFLVVGFKQLVRLRMFEEGLGLDEGIRAVLSDNLFGLELDPRCTHLAAFNVALAAWRLAGRVIDLPPVHVACSGIAVGGTKQDWTALAGDDERVVAGMGRLYDLFEQAPDLGSLIDPRLRGGDLLEAGFAELESTFTQALGATSQDVDRTEQAVTAQGLAVAAELLAGEYTLVVTNVPYLARGKQSDTLREFALDNYDSSKADLATVFLQRSLGWLEPDGTVAAVTPQNWLFLTTYSTLREQILTGCSLNCVAFLGSSAFQVMNWWAATTALVVLSARRPTSSSDFCCIDVGADKSLANKAAYLAE
ncbi:MAG TPA: N-6 DNA methylase, partial [Bryobacteraceae bacterium]|nr:N-6 DNA methylase [Bryobacteraceae bacterium]